MPPSTTPSTTTSKKGRPRLSAIGETPAKSTSSVKQPIPSSVDPVLVPAVLETELPASASASASVLLCASTPHETEYLNSLSPIERNVCIIAKEHLQSSFDLDRSNGFISWKKK